MYNFVFVFSTPDSQLCPYFLSAEIILINLRFPENTQNDDPSITNIL